MSDIRKWHARAVCPKCDWSIYAPFRSIFHVQVSCCPECGYEKYDGHSLSGLYRYIRYFPSATNTMDVFMSHDVSNPYTHFDSLLGAESKVSQ